MSLLRFTVLYLCGFFTPMIYSSQFRYFLAIVLTFSYSCCHDECLSVHHRWYEEREQLDATQKFIELIICSICFGHYYVHHQEPGTIQMFTACGI